MSAQVTILQLPAASAITGAEAVPIVQNGVTVQTTTGAIAAAPSQVYTYLTVSQTSQLPNSRYVGVTNGLVITDAGAQGLFNISTTGALLSLVNSGTGFQVKTSSTALTGRSIAVSGAGLAIANGDGIAGDPTIALTGQVLNLANASLNGFVVLTSAGAITSTTLTGTANQIGITNTNGVGNPVFSIANDPVMPGTGAMTIPIGTTGQQPIASVSGMIRYDTTAGAFYGYSGGAWNQFSLSGGVTQVNTGTGLTGGPIIGVGTISIDNTTVAAGSYGSTTQVGTFTVNAQGQLTAAANATISAVLIGAVTNVNGTANEITSTGATTITLALPAALTFTGKTVTNGTFNMTAATVGTDTVTTNTATQTLTNKTMSGSTNTFTSIPNSGLANSQVTLGTTNIALGGTALTIGGLTTVTVTQDPTTNFELATKQYVDTIAALGLHYHSAVAVSSPVSAGNLTATYVGGGTSTTITTIANGADITFASGAPTVGDQFTAATSNGFVSGTQYWVRSVSGSTFQASLTYGGAAITGLSNGTGLSIASVINAGIGATLTNAGAQAALTVDGILTTVGMRVLIFNQTSQLQNGVYTVTTVGTVSTNWVMTRATDADTYQPGTSTGLGQGDAFFVTQGTQNAGSVYAEATSSSIFFGQTSITFVQISTAPVYSAGTGLTLTGSVFSIANTAVTAGAYGSATQVGTFTVNAQGQLTLAGNTTVTPAVGSITGLGTGVATALALNVGFAGAFVTFNGALGTPSSGTLTNATGLPLTTGVTGTLPVANGGTGLTAGTSGGILAYTGTGTLASSALLAANALMIGGGIGVAPSTTTTGTGVLTFLGTPSSANLAAAVTDETGSGVLVFGTSPTFTTSLNSGASFTAFAGATTLLTIGGTGASSVVAHPGTLEQSGTTGSATFAGGVYIAKILTAAGGISGGTF